MIDYALFSQLAYLDPDTQDWAALWSWFQEDGWIVRGSSSSHATFHEFYNKERNLTVVAGLDFFFYLELSCSFFNIFLHQLRERGC